LLLIESDEASEEDLVTGLWLTKETELKKANERRARTKE